MVAPNFYNTVDQGIYNQGYSFIPQERFRGAFNPNTNIGFGSGITNTAAAAPFILPINQGGGGDGGGNITGPADNSGFDYETDAYDLDNMSAADKGLTDEEQEALDNMNNPATTKGMMGTIGATMFGFMNPISAMFSLNYQRNKQKEAAEQAAKDAAAKADFDRAMADQKGFYDSLNDGKGASVSQESRDNAGDGNQAGPSPFADGGRVPYMMGGLANLVDIYD